MLPVFMIYFASLVSPNLGLPLPGVLLPELRLPDITGICDGCQFLPPLESTGCNVSSVPVATGFEHSLLKGDWYLAFYNHDGILKRIFESTGFYSVNNVRFTIAGDIFPDQFRVYQCNKYEFLGGLISRVSCPNVEFGLITKEEGVYGPDLPSLLLPIVRTLVPKLNPEKIEIRVIGGDFENFVVFYGCDLPMEDGTCAKGGLAGGVLTKTMEVSPSVLTKIRSAFASTCISFDVTIKKMMQNSNYPFPEPPLDFQY